MAADPIGFLVAIEFGDTVRPLFFRDRNEAEAYRANRPALGMCPIYWGDGSFSLTEPENAENA